MHATSFRGVSLALLCTAGLYLSACDEPTDLIAPEPTVSGQVINGANGEPVGGAIVAIGAAADTTDGDGRFALSSVDPGPASIHCTTLGYAAFESGIVVKGSSLAYDIALTRTEMFEVGNWAVFIPAAVGTVRGVLLAVGGPDTRAFATAKSFGTPLPEMESSLQWVGVQLRSFAVTHSLAILGTSQINIPNAVESDQLIRQLLRNASEASGRPGFQDLPLLLYGLSGSGAVVGYAARNPARIAGLFLKFPLDVAGVSGDATDVPTYMVQAEFEPWIDNASLAAQAESNRKSGGLWAMARERGVQHHSFSVAQRELTVEWIRAILDRRLPTGAGALRSISESGGWLGNPATGVVSTWAAYEGDRTVASWFPNEATALRWQAFIK